MYANHPYIATQIAHEYTRDRIREAESYRTTRQAKAGRRRHVEPSVHASAGGSRRRQWFFPARTRVA